MRNSLTLIVITIFILLTGCRKKDSPQYSYWRVNTDSFSSNEVNVDRGKARTDLETKTIDNGFGFTFYLNHLPTFGTFFITNTIIQHPLYVGMDIHYKGNYFNVAQDLRNKIVAKEVNGKAQYLLLNTWFKNYFNSNDSVLVSGTFNEP